MPKKTTLTGAHLVVEIDDYHYRRPLERKVMKTRADELIEAIKRHCDGWTNISTEYNTEEVCEFCGYPWTEDSNSYNHGCCNADVDADEARTKDKEA